MCWGEKKVPVLILTILSSLMIVCGVIMVIECIVYQTSQSVLTADLGSLTTQIQSFKNSTFGVLIGFSATAIIVGIFGTLCHCKPCDSIVFPILFGITLTAIWIVFIVVGAVLTTVSVAGP
jgi:hypothetical protein